MAPLNKTAFHFSQRTELLDFLLEVSSQISRTIELEPLLETIGGIISQVIPGNLVAILLYDEVSGELKLRHGQGHREELLRSLSIPLGEGITGVAAKERKAIVSGDVRTHPHYLAAVDAVRSEIAVPMEAGGKLVGVIDVQSTQSDAYTEYDQLLLQLLSSRIAYAVENARLYQQAERQNETLKHLAEIAQQVGLLLDLDTLLGKVAGILHGYVAYASFNIFLVDEAHQMLRHRFSLRYDQRVRFADIPINKGVTGHTYRSRQITRVADALRDPRFIVTQPDIRSEIAVPLMVQDKVVGILDLESEQLNYFTEDHVQLLTLLAPQLAIAVENARLYEELSQRERTMEADLEAARELQSFLLPRIPIARHGLEIEARLAAARTISGDLYDYMELDGGKVLFAVGDVSGKGAAAALYGAMVSGLLRSLAPSVGSPRQILTLLNQSLLTRRVHARYVTMMLAVWDPARRVLRLANSGGLPPLIVRPSGVEDPRLEGLPLGLLAKASYDEIEIAMHPGDLAVFVSDGVADQTNAEEADYGKERLGQLLFAHRADSLPLLCDTVLADVTRFAGGAPVFDDQTIIALRVQS
ncbi:MAG: SpoIIE family protein phosphatase [Bryobacterales bacterium]|jgi:sigma-B regulation protein RsbU (phosphoserine phosphatase)|nr:SpoIIE family protein phosphatase [Bryobacterales bacterium]